MDLKTWCEKNDVTPLELAGMIDISYNFAYRLVRGDRNPGLNIAVKIETATNGEVKPKDFVA